MRVILPLALQISVSRRIRSGDGVRERSTSSMTVHRHTRLGQQVRGYCFARPGQDSRDMKTYARSVSSIRTPVKRAPLPFSQQLRQLV